MSDTTTKENVRAQLMYEWDDEINDDGDCVPVKGKQLMTEQQADALIEKHKKVFDECKLMRSYAYYTANEILKAEGRAQ